METRLLHKCIGGVCCIAAVALLIGVVGERRPQTADVRATVFVDLDTLTTLHPAWEQLEHIRSSLEHLRAYEGLPEVETADVGSWIHDSCPVDPEVQRQDLQRQLAEDAETQLARVEALLFDAVRRRVQSKDQELQNEVAQELIERRRQEDRRLATNLRTVREDWSIDRVNEELRRIAALRRAELAEQDDEELTTRAASYIEEQALWEERRASIEHELISDSRESVRELERLRQKEIHSDLDRLQFEELRRVDTLLSDYKARLTPILDGQGFGDLKLSFANEASRSWANVSEFKPAEDNGPVIRDAVKALTERHRKLEQRIIKDIARVLQRVADAQSLKLVFSASDDYPDYTEYFAGLILEPRQLGELLSGSG